MRPIIEVVVIDMKHMFSSLIVFCAVQMAVPAFAQQPAAAAGKVVSKGVTRATGRLMTTIQGNALSSTNGSLPNTLVRLRDARFGKIVDTQLSDKSGLFAFKAVDPGTYVVEVVGADQSTVLAASQLLNVSAGDAISAVVKLPFRLPPLAGLLGNSTPSATAVATQAAASGVLATTTAVEDVSPK